MTLSRVNLSPALIRTAGPGLCPVRESWVHATERVGAGSSCYTLLVGAELANTGVAMVPALQAVRIVTGRCWRRRNDETDKGRQDGMTHIFLSCSRRRSRLPSYAEPR